MFTELTNFCFVFKKHIIKIKQNVNFFSTSVKINVKWRNRVQRTPRLPSHLSMSASSSSGVTA